jgi:transketolase
MNAMNEQRSEWLESLAARVREHVIRMSEGAGCFVGASLSCVDILVSLYADCVRLSPDRLDDPERDIVLLSKGHAVPALYGTLAELGYLDPLRLGHHLRTDDVIYWHPNRTVPGVEFQSGSLGHLLSVGIGMALDARLRNSQARVFVVVGDGELNEGTLWEGALVAQAQELERLVLIVDRNQLQANARTEHLVPLEPLAAKLIAFGWNTIRVDGHNFGALHEALLSSSTRRPTAIIANTVRGCGVPELEGRTDKWFVKSTPADVSRLIAALKDTCAQRMSLSRNNGSNRHDTV